MSKKKSSEIYMFLSTTYDDGYSDNVRLIAFECWTRFYDLVAYFCHHPFCGILSVTISDCREKPILTITNNFKTLKS